MLSSVACCLPAGLDSKALLAENWITAAAHAAAASAASSAATAPPAFSPGDASYSELARRLSKCAAMRSSQQLGHAQAVLEKALSAAGGLTGGAKEAKRAELEEVAQQLGDAQAAVADVQASFEQDPLALAPWMNALFALADSGCTFFDAGGGSAGPLAAAQQQPAQAAAAPLKLVELLAPPCAATGGPAGLSTWLYRGHERVLGTFKRRYELERGADTGIKVATRLALNCGEGAMEPAALAAAVEAALDASCLAVLGAAGMASGGLLDCVLLHWFDWEDAPTFLAVLRALNHFVARPGWSAEQQQEVGIESMPPKAAALGLVEPTPEAVTAAVRAGVSLSWVVLNTILLDTSSTAVTAALCASHGIKVIAAAPLAHGLISEAFLGVGEPDTASAAAPVAAAGVDGLAAGLDMVARFGSWLRFQQLLRCLKAIAGQHGTSMQVVALAWLLRRGVVPLLPAHWTPGSNGAPWWLSLGLPHFRPEALPLPRAASAMSAAAVAAAAQEPGSEPDSAPAAATASEEAGAEEDGSSKPPAVSGTEVAKSGAEQWAAYLQGLLSDADLEVLAAIAGQES